MEAGDDFYFDFDVGDDFEASILMLATMEAGDTNLLPDEDDDEDTKKVLIDDDEREAAIESKGERQCDYEKPRGSYTKTSADRRIQVPGIRLEV
ncbi:hypothetical protein E3N88_03585 [Mikania micrantha]|uniref:Uncharacterized protein n=1 Tax=Mikania micrantha TaxID=192012 RepID=A0A5N6Q729_9ASTR|nr:hypothetical protein E3N88_03585 [Mikania micrantha]